MSEYRVVAAADLESAGSAIFEHLGTPPDIAAEVAAHLVRANLAGHDSHGAIRIPQYAGMIQQGTIVPAGRPSVLQRRGASLLIDAAGGFGQFAAAYALEAAIGAARELGIAAAAIRRVNHIG